MLDLVGLDVSEGEIFQRWWERVDQALVLWEALSIDRGVGVVVVDIIVTLRV